MFDIGSSELLLIVIVAVLVIGPKDLPRALYKVGQIVGKARGMAKHFRTGLDTMIREAEMEELQKKWAADNERIMAEHPMPAALPDEAADIPYVEAAPNAILSDPVVEPVPVEASHEVAEAEPAVVPVPAAPVKAPVAKPAKAAAKPVDDMPQLPLGEPGNGTA